MWCEVVIMSGNDRKKVNKEEKKVSTKGLKNVINAIGRRIFSKVHKHEVEYGQTLSKKRRKNCVLKSVSSLSCPDDGGRLTHSPYDINFQFSKDDFRGTFDVQETCCGKCIDTLRKDAPFSRFSVSSDSACEVSSESSCDDINCKYRKTKTKRKAKSYGDVSRGIKSIKSFIRIHNENFKEGIVNPVCELETQRQASHWIEEPKYESLISRLSGIKPFVDDSYYDILVTGPNCRVMEPSYENLKLIENFYEMPECRHRPLENDKTKEAPQSKSYDEVIESLKLWHMTTKYTENASSCACCGERLENEYNHCMEEYESLENDFNNDIEEFCC